MTVEVKAFPKEGFTWLQVAGVFSTADLEVFERCLTAGKCDVQCVLLDLGAVSDVQFGFRRILTTAHALTDHLALDGSRILVSIFAPLDHVFGEARIFETLLSESEHVQVTVSEKREDAVAALGLSHVPAELLRA